jgi:signal transduction histidine kinase/ActR/RegA family two-component response regulator
LQIEHEQPRSAFWRHPRAALLGGLALTVTVASAPLFLAADATWVLAWSISCMIVIVATTTLRCFATTRRLHGPERSAWRFISLAFTSFLLAQLIWSAYELILGIPNPMPAASDIGYLIAPLLLMIGIWLYRTTAPTLSMFIVQLGNIGILMAAVFLADTIIFQRRLEVLESPITTQVLILYAAVAMTAFIFAAFNIFFYMRGSRRRVMTPLLLGLGSLALSDYLAGFEFESGNAISTSFVNVGYFITFAFGYWAAFEQDQIGTHPVEEPGSQAINEAALRWETLLLPAAITGLVAVALTHRENLTTDLVPNATGALILFLAAIAMRDWWSRRIEAQLRDGTRTAAAALQKSERHLLAKNDELEAANRELSKEMAARLQIQGELRHSQKMEAIGQLTGGVAHDFNNLLAVIVGNVDLLEETLEPGSSQRVFTREALAAANRGASLTDRLLAFSRKQALDPRPIGVNDLLKSMTGLLERTLGETIQLRFEMSASTAPCLIDRAQLENAILNLVLNARDAMSSSGLITIETSNVTLDERDVAQHPDASAGDYVSIAVSDTGAGMSDQVRARAFEPFFTTKDVGLGSGLGLSMVYGFVNQSGGHVSIESTEEMGTEVRLYIPRTNLLPDPIEDIDVGAAPAGQQESVLVVEDDPAVRKVIVSFLEQQNYRVTAAANSSDALAILDDRGPFDLLLSDVILPGKYSGTELANAIISRQPSMKILLMSGYASDAFEKTAGPSDDANLLQKPFSMGKLAREVRSVLDSEEGGLDSEEGGDPVPD